MLATLLRSTKPISPYQFAGLRILLGLYLIWQFAILLLNGTERSHEDGIFYGLLDWTGSPVLVVLAIALLCSFLLTLGVYRRTSCAVLYFFWAILIGHYNFIAHPGLPSIGLVLLLCAFVPRGDALALGLKRWPSHDWQFPALVYWTAWILLAVGYSYVGITKFESTDWIDGSAIAQVLDSPLARPGFIRDLLLALPEGTTNVMTWGILGLEAGFVLFSFHRVTRLIAWFALLLMHFGILLVIDVPSISLAMILVHLFTFDPAWFRPRKPETEDENIVFFDGDCLLCKGSVQFLMMEDREKVLSFAPLQGETAKARLPETSQELKSIIYLQKNGQSATRSTAILNILDTSGGLWRPLSWIGRLIPSFIRDFAYDTIANNRYKWFGKQDDACSLLPPEHRSRLLD